MARVWKRTADKRKSGTPWMLTYTDWKIVDGRWVSWERTKTAYTDKRESMALGTQLEDKAKMKRDGRIDEREDRRAIEARRDTSSHIDDYEAALVAKGSNPKHVGQTIGYIREIVDALEWTTIGSIRADALMRHLSDRRTKLDWSPRTFNARLTAIKSFTRWLVQHDRLQADPLASTRAIRQTSGQRRKRRALSEMEADRLIDAATAGDEIRFTREGTRYTLTGPDRAMLYGLMLGTGLRLSEAGSLTPRSFDLDGPDGPAVVVEAAYSKRRRRDAQPLPAALADLLRIWLEDRPVDAPLWPLPHHAAQRLLVPDLRRARARWLLTIPKGKARRKAQDEDTLRYRDSAGRFADLHALRHSYITRLSISGMPLPMAQRLARHSSPTLTANTYTHIGIADSQAALDRAFGKPTNTVGSPDIARATGTEGTPIEPETERCAQRYAQRESDGSSLKLTSGGTTPATSEATDNEGPITRTTLETKALGTVRHGQSDPDNTRAENAPRRTRTFNPLIKSQLLCRLS